MTTIDRFKDIQFEAAEVFKRKNKDYGDSFKEDGILGIMIRMKDKLNRYITLAKAGGEAACRDESLRDTLLDFHNYAVMAIICAEEGARSKEEKDEL
ncbi:MAG: nucleotide modification associated domain-containing protein [Deltaproteobacteria bacterium]